MFSIVNGVSIGRDAFVTVVNLYNMNSFCCKLCKGIGQGDPEKCNSLCIYCSNVLLTRDLNEIQTKKSQPTNLLQKRKNATLKGLETSKKITPEFEIPVEKYYIASLQNESTEKTAKKGRMWNTYHHQFTELLEALCSNQITLIHNQKKT